MRSVFKVPEDLPAAACGRCYWWQQKNQEGWGKCQIWNEKRFYQCMVCPEYEMDPRVRPAK